MSHLVGPDEPRRELAAAACAWSAADAAERQAADVASGALRGPRDRFDAAKADLVHAEALAEDAHQRLLALAHALYAKSEPCEEPCGDTACGEAGGWCRKGMPR